MLLYENAVSLLLALGVAGRLKLNSPCLLGEQMEQSSGSMGRFQRRTSKAPSGIVDYKENIGLKGANPAPRSI